MKKFITENFSFTIEVVGPTNEGKPLSCRNGHEIGDSYVCEYGCPEPTNGCGGFCSKTMMKLFPLLEAVRSGGDLRNLLPGVTKHTCLFRCPDGVVDFRLQAHDLAEIRPLTVERLPEYAEVIRKSFATVAQDFGWTQETAPTFTAYIQNEKLAEKIKDGYYPFGMCVKDKIIGFVSLTDMGGGVFELNHLSVIWRHYGYGRQLLNYCKDKVREIGGNKITIGIVEENTVLKDWYIANGFVHTGTKKFEHLPFTTGFMEWRVLV